MNNMIELAKQQVKETVMNALGRLVAEGKIEAVPLPAFNVERPADVSHGDFSCNAAMAVAAVTPEAVPPLATSRLPAVSFISAILLCRMATYTLSSPAVWMGAMESLPRFPLV